jgi:multidrug transporter EmrE-like cation transporter
MWFIILAGILWGVTNPLLKKYTGGFAKKDDDPNRREKGVWSDVRFLLQRPKYLAAQITNFAGSVAFAKGMSEASLSVGPAVANSLAMGLTIALSPLVLGEDRMSGRTAAGVALIFIGMLCCTTA